MPNFNADDVFDPLLVDDSIERLGQLLCATLPQPVLCPSDAEVRAWLRRAPPLRRVAVERAVRDVRDDCFGGERIRDLAAARARAERWCRDEYGAHRHSTTGRMPREHFLNVEAPALLSAPEQPYDLPKWCTPKVARDHFVQVERALYSMPTRMIGRTLRARVDRTTVRFYDRSILIRICRRLPPGGRSIDPEDFPKEKRAYAMRDIEFLQKQADELGSNIGAYVRRLLSGPLPWTSMRTVHGVRGLAERYGVVPCW